MGRKSKNKKTCKNPQESEERTDTESKRTDTESKRTDTESKRTDAEKRETNPERKRADTENRRTDIERRRTDTEKTDSASLDSLGRELRDLSLDGFPSQEELELIDQNLDVLADLGKVLDKADTQKLPPGSHIYECQAYIFAVSDEHRTSICHFCLLEFPMYIGCRCRFAQYCSEECKEMDYKLYHKYECDMVKNCTDGDIPSTLTRFLAQLSQKIRENADEIGDKFGRRIYSLFTIRSHYKDVFQLEKASQEFWNEMGLLEALCDPNKIIAPSLMMDVFDRARIQCRDVDVGFRRNVGVALCLGLQAFDHSCKPSCAVTWRDKKAVVRTIEEVTLTSDRELTLSWIPTVFGGRDTRNDMLNNLVFFSDTCECKRCWDDDFEILVKEIPPEMPAIKNIKFFKAALENPKLITKKKLEQLLKASSKLTEVSNFCSDRVVIMEKIAKICVDHKKYVEATKFYNKVINAYEFYYGRNHPMTGAAYFALFFVDRELKKFLDARAAFNEGYERLKVAYGEDHPFIQELQKEKENN